MNMVFEMRIVLVDKQHGRCACRMAGSHVVNAITDLWRYQGRRN
jgi:hypothetical protein